MYMIKSDNKIHLFFVISKRVDAEANQPQITIICFLEDPQLFAIKTFDKYLGSGKEKKLLKFQLLLRFKEIVSSTILGKTISTISNFLKTFSIRGAFISDTKLKSFSSVGVLKRFMVRKIYTVEVL